MMNKVAQLLCSVFMSRMVYAQINLASNGTASQSSTYSNYDASLAVLGGPTHDWNTGSCSVTDIGKTVAWWMLTFPSETVFTSRVVIYYRSDIPGRLAGYSLYITNNSILPNADNPPSNGLCYHHNDTELPNILQNITCNQMGKHVIIYNERKSGVTYPNGFGDKALLELCDVQIIGCYKSWWGDDCRKPCPSCIDNHCYPDNGTCVLGCNSTNCFNGSCTNDGICTDGCIKGLAGLPCNKRNVANEAVMISTANGSATQLTQITDGDKTESSCVTLREVGFQIQIDTGELRAIKTINIVFKNDTGYHEYSLSILNSSGVMAESLNLTNQNLAEYMSPFPVNEHNLESEVIGRYVQLRSNVSTLEICEVEIIGCPSGFYGDQCDKTCPSNCDGACNPENGECVLGCKNRYFGRQCEKLCEAPLYGRSCSETCHCLYQPCNAIDGTCPPGGCEDGWEGQSCSTEILCRPESLPKHISYFPSLSVHRYRQNVTFYCASGFYGTSVNSTCITGNTWIPSPPICSSETEAEGVSVVLFISVIVSVIIIAASVIGGVCMFSRRQ